MLFNTWFGQMRWQQVNFKANLYNWVYRPKRPIGQIQLRSLLPPDSTRKRENALYVADERGNMDIRAPAHIRNMIDLGYPIYNGMFTGPTSQDDLLWPSNPEYDRRVLEGLNQALDSKIKTVKKGKQ